MTGHTTTTASAGFVWLQPQNPGQEPRDTRSSNQKACDDGSAQWPQQPAIEITQSYDFNGRPSKRTQPNAQRSIGFHPTGGHRIMIFEHGVGVGIEATGADGSKTSYFGRAAANFLSGMVSQAPANASPQETAQPQDNDKIIASNYFVLRIVSFWEKVTCPLMNISEMNNGCLISSQKCSAMISSILLSVQDGTVHNFTASFSVVFLSLTQ